MRRSPFRLFGSERGGRRLQFSTVGQDFDPAFGVLQPGVAEARELDTAFAAPATARAAVPLLELLHDRLELGDRALEILDGYQSSRTLRELPARDARHADIIARARAVDASRITRVRSAFQQTA